MQNTNERTTLKREIQEENQRGSAVLLYFEFFGFSGASFQFCVACRKRSLCVHSGWAFFNRSSSSLMKTLYAEGGREAVPSNNKLHQYERKKAHQKHTDDTK
eukprot:TRINITY_DN767_c0_g1_i3.p1 TRINITY_DN767_c0_g1~~TRINITY_DN767_c0_g1_i3.p1  ORF type:complete len:102 (-),score=8.30 TRINITY_DN767_c0_g1_i3:110-415(-)